MYFDVARQNSNALGNGKFPHDEHDGTSGDAFSQKGRFAEGGAQLADEGDTSSPMIMAYPPTAGNADSTGIKPKVTEAIGKQTRHSLQSILH
jgi:hypothetical protein